MRVRRNPRLGDGKMSFIPNDTDHDGWLLLSENIRMVGRVQYARLYDVIGNRYGGTAQSTTFGLPPAGQRFLLGSASNMQAGSTGGVAEVTLTPDQMPKHKHGYDRPSLGAPENVNVIGSILGGVIRGLSIPRPQVGTGETTEAGGGQSHTNMPPYMAVNFFIFAGTPRS